MFIIAIFIGVFVGSLTFVLIKKYVDDLPKQEKTFIFKKTKKESDEINSEESDYQIRKRMRLLHDEMQRSMYGGVWQSHTVTIHILPDLDKQDESLETLNNDLKLALADEDYSKAAQIRDKIKEKENDIRS